MERSAGYDKWRRKDTMVRSRLFTPITVIGGITGGGLYTVRPARIDPNTANNPFIKVSTFYILQIIMIHDSDDVLQQFHLLLKLRIRNIKTLIFTFIQTIF